MTDEHKYLASGHCIVPSNGCSAVLKKTPNGYYAVLQKRPQEKDNASEHHAAHHDLGPQKEPYLGM